MGMWLLPALSRVSSWCVRAYYDFESAGETPPRHGPVLFVANHPNSLIDPAFVAAVAGRPVRFLAKAPLFDLAHLGWLIRASGAIPVHRRQDDPARMGQNVLAFEAVFRALSEGYAVGIFPEGISHSEPSLVPLRTGAARIALGAAERTGAAFPIVPIGIVLRHKERFRSRAFACVGDRIPWTDLASAGETDVAAVRELTAKIEEGLRAVTLNLERWEDAAAVEWAEKIYTAEYGLDRTSAVRLERQRQVATALSTLRSRDPARTDDLYAAVCRFGGLLSAFGADPADLERRPRLRAAAGWLVPHLLFFLLGAPVALVGAVSLFVPYRLTGVVADISSREAPDVLSTAKLFGGLAIYLAWITLLALVASLAAGPRTGVLVFVGLPILGFLTQQIRERWGEAREAVRRYALLTRRSDLREQLLAWRHELAGRLDRIRTELAD